MVTSQRHMNIEFDTEQNNWLHNYITSFGESALVYDSSTTSDKKLPRIKTKFQRSNIKSIVLIFQHYTVFTSKRRRSRIMCNKCKLLSNITV